MTCYIVSYGPAHPDSKSLHDCAEIQGAYLLSFERVKCPLYLVPYALLFLVCVCVLCGLFMLDGRSPRRLIPVRYVMTRGCDDSSCSLYLRPVPFLWFALGLHGVQQL
jgi:hypothetical protein